MSTKDSLSMEHVYIQKEFALKPFLSCASLREIELMLEEYVTEERRKKIERILNQRLPSIHVACESPSDIHNALAIVRTAEALGITNIHIIDEELRRNEGRGTMKGAQAWSRIFFYKTLDAFSKREHGERFRLIGIDPHASLSLSQLDMNEPVCFLFGNEKRGLSDEAKKSCAEICTIPMFGMTESFNLSVSAGIALYEVTKKKRALLGNNGEIPEEEKRFQKVRAYIRTIGYENALKMVRSLK